MLHYIKADASEFINQSLFAESRIYQEYFMSKQTLVSGLSVLCSLLTAQALNAAPVAEVSLVSSGMSYYQLSFKGISTTLEQIKVESCHNGSDCQGPKVVYHQEVKMKIQEDRIPVDGPKIIDLGKGYKLEMFYQWGGSTMEKQYRLLLPSKTRTERQDFVPLQLHFDIVESK